MFALLLKIAVGGLQIGKRGCFVYAEKMLPRFAAANVGKRLCINPVFRRHLGARDASYVRGSDCQHGTFRQLCANVALSLWRILSRSLFPDAVMIVVPVRSERQVQRVDAERRVATMQDQNTGWDRAFCYCVGEAMSQPLAPLNAVAAIAFVVGAGGPKPATITHSNLRPKSYVFHSLNLWDMLPLFKPQVVERNK